MQFKFGFIHVSISTQISLCSWGYLVTRKRKVCGPPTTSLCGAFFGHVIPFGKEPHTHCLTFYTLPQCNNRKLEASDKDSVITSAKQKIPAQRTALEENKALQGNTEK